nr:hypothetical protein [Tanacetum cinerariifolium]
MWDKYAQKRNELGHVVFILQLGKVKYWDEIQVFRQRFKELPEYDENQFKISVFTLQSRLSQSWNFSLGRSRRWSHRFVNVNRNPTASSTQRFTEYTKKMDGPILHVKSVTKRELLDLVGKRFLFKIYFSNYNVNNNNHTYKCDAVNDDPEFIKHFKDGFMQDEDYEDDFTTPTNKIKVNNFTDDSLNRVLEMPPPSIEMGASGSGDENEYNSSDSVCLADEDSNFDDSIYTTEFLNGLRMSGICNGTRLQVLRLGINIIEAQIMSGGSVGTICDIPRMVISLTDTKMPFKLNRCQFPIQVCFAMTINK